MRDPRGDEAIGRNFPKIFGLRFRGDFLPIVPVLILFYTSNGLNSTQVFAIQALFHLAVLILEVPSGYLADVIVLSPVFGLIVDTAPLSVAFMALGGFFLVSGAALTGAIARHWHEGPSPFQG